MVVQASGVSRNTALIVGAGYSGAMAALHLLKADARCRVVLLERRGVFARGLAYQDHDDNLLLNVPAGNMSALPDAPDDFVDWCRALDPALGPASFVSRRLYGDYLQARLAAAQAAAGGRLQRVVGEAVACERTAGVTRLLLADGRQFEGAGLLLAPGHFGPRDPLPAPGLAAFGEHQASPWDLAALDALPRALPVLLLGSGHTAVDALFRLCSGARPRPVLMVSRHGLLPQAHRPRPQPPAGAPFPVWIDRLPQRVGPLMRALRAECAARQAAGDDWRDALNELRPHTPAIWQRLPLAERRRFLRHAVPFWDVHRHRLAPVAAQRLQGLLEAGAVERLAARVVALRRQGDAVEITLRRRGSTVTETRLVGAVVNATGPNLDLARWPSTLLQQLAAQGLLRADPAGLGLEVAADYRVVGRDGQPVSGLWVLGPMLKSRDWEAIAVPELRHHAARVAQRMARFLCMHRHAEDMALAD